MLPEIAVDANEHEIRLHIRDTLNAEKSLGGCLLNERIFAALLNSQTLVGRAEP